MLQGRILGMKVLRQKGSESASLVGCDTSRGLIQIDDVDNDAAGHNVQILTENFSDPITFCNSVVISPDQSSIYFTDSSKRRIPDVSCLV